LTQRKFKGETMKIPTEARHREELLKNYRDAVAYQIGLWEAALLITETLDCELAWVLDNVNAAAITADTGMELTGEDLDDFLGIGDPGRIVTGKLIRVSTGYRKRPVETVWTGRT
jgi:hypothetical protein